MANFKLGLDLDGVMCNNLPFWNVVFNTNMRRHEHTIEATVAHHWYYYRDICRKCFGKVLHDPKIIKNFVPFEEAVDTYKYLSSPFFSYKERQIDIRFITSRPKDVEDVTVKWVYKWFNPKEEGHCHVLQGKKGTFYKDNEFDLVVDDSPEQIMDLKEHGVPVLIMDHPYNRDIEGPRVYNITDMEDKIIDYFTKGD